MALDKLHLLMIPLKSSVFFIGGILSDHNLAMPKVRTPKVQKPMPKVKPKVKVVKVLRQKAMPRRRMKKARTGKNR